MKCKKGDFGGVKDLGVSVKNRKLLFYGICIWVRLGLVYLTYLLYNKTWFPYLVAGISSLSLFFIKFEKEKCVWWSRRIHKIMLILVLIASIHQIIVKDKNYIISILIFIDLIIGLISSLILKWR